MLPRRVTLKKPSLFLNRHTVEMSVLFSPELTIAVRLYTVLEWLA